MYIGEDMIKAVLFDLDGTLVNSLGDLAASTNYALSEFGFPTHETECFKYFVGDGMPKLIERALPEEKRDENTRKRVLATFMEHYRAHFADRTAAYEGIGELISALRDMGLKTAVISNKVQEMTLVVVQKLFGDCFEVVCGKQEGFPTKPDPALTLKVMGQLGVTPEECVLIGDSGMDAAAAVNAGCIGIGVLWGFRTRDELLKNGAKYIAEKPQDIISILKETGV